MATFFGILAATLVGGYVIGSLPFGFWIAQCHGIDLRTAGSGNIGATNVVRTLGKGWGILAFVLDFLKGIGPVCGTLLIPSSVVEQGAMPAFWDLDMFGWVAGGAAIVGHVFPFWLGFRGGKGVATSAGVLLGWAPVTTSVGVGVWLITIAIFRIVSLSSLLAALAIMVWGWSYLFPREGPGLPLILTILSALVYWRHRSNLRRLLKGQEPRIGGAQKAPESAEH